MGWHLDFYLKTSLAGLEAVSPAALDHADRKTSTIS
jgi:hypothetical protein